MHTKATFYPICALLVASLFGCNAESQDKAKEAGEHAQAALEAGGQAGRAVAEQTEKELKQAAKDVDGKLDEWGQKAEARLAAVKQDLDKLEQKAEAAGADVKEATREQLAQARAEYKQAQADFEKAKQEAAAEAAEAREDLNQSLTHLEAAAKKAADAFE